MRIFRERDDNSLTICYEASKREMEILELIGSKGYLEYEGNNYPNGMDIYNVVKESELVDLIYYGFLKDDEEYFKEGSRKYILSTIGYEFLIFR